MLPMTFAEEYPFGEDEEREYSEAYSSSGIQDSIITAQEEVVDIFRARTEDVTEADESEDNEERFIPQVPVSFRDVLLQGLGLGANDAFAVLNGELYAIGEEKDGIKLVEVRKGEADVIVDGATRKLFFVDAEDLAKYKRQNNESIFSFTDERKR